MTSLKQFFTALNLYESVSEYLDAEDCETVYKFHKELSQPFSVQRLTDIHERSPELHISMKPFEQLLQNIVNIYGSQ